MNNNVIHVELPYFVRITFPVVTRFLEAIGLDAKQITKIEFPHYERGVDPSRSTYVKFSIQGGFYLDDFKIVFNIEYRPGEEGTGGIVNRISTIDYFVGDDKDAKCVFYYLEHYCGCKHCKGMKYPFMPSQGVSPGRSRSFIEERQARGNFECMSEKERLSAIREYIRGNTV